MTRRANHVMQERIVLAYDHAQATETGATKLWKAPRAFRLDRALYINPTGLAEDATNYFEIRVMNGATEMALWSTETGAEGTIAADTFVEPTLAADSADLVLAADDVISFDLTEGGTATLPAGRLVLEGRYL